MRATAILSGEGEKERVVPVVLQVVVRVSDGGASVGGGKRGSCDAAESGKGSAAHRLRSQPWLEKRGSLV